MNTPALEIGAIFLSQAREQFRLCHGRIRHCVNQLSQEQLWHRAGEELNSIANLLLHLNGNITQRILSLIGGEPDTRDRQREFDERGPIAKAALIGQFDQTIASVDELLATLHPERLAEKRAYRMLKGDVEGTVLTLILQTLVHLGGHTQEIVALTRLQLGDRYRFLQQPEVR